MLVIFLKKLTITQKLNKIEKKMNNHIHDKYINTQEFNELMTD